MKNKHDHLKETVGPGVFTEWQEVDVEICSFTDLGVNVAINNEYKGLVYGNQLFGDYRKGQKLKAFIKGVRDDGKIDVSFQPRQDRHVLSTADTILEHLEAAGGKLRLNDKSSPEDIQKEFHVSKKVFKQAIGGLYKQRKIKMTDAGIELVI